jgi:type I restriction enzyme, S subunit
LYTTVGSYGNAARVTDQRKFAFQRHIAHLKPRYELFDPLFFVKMLESPLVRRQADSAARGAAQKTVNLFDLKNFVIIRPPLPEQRRFAAKIKAITTIRNGAQSSLRKLDALFASLQHRALRGEL